MKRLLYAAVGVLSIWVAADERASSQPRASVAQLAWLAGCWAYVGAEPGSGETWMPPAGGALLASARTVQGGKLVSYEFQRIVESDEGLAFFASPSGQPEVRFALASLAANEVVFENLANDFPQRVIYRLAQDGGISARIEGAQDDPARALDFPMARTSCVSVEKPR